MRRIPVVLDTNVWVRNFKTRSAASPNRRVVRLWLLEKRMHLIVSREIVVEYLGIFADVLGMDEDLVEERRCRFEENARTALVNLGPRDEKSRDPDDNLFLATARAGKAKFLLTNDRDLLDLPASVQKNLSYAIMTPQDYLAAFDVGL